MLEQELQLLLKEELNSGVDDVKIESGSEDPKSAIKKRVRVIKNRLAAKRSREQARSYVQQLESTLSALAAKNDFLARRLAVVEAENCSLKRGLPTNVQKEARGEPAVLPYSSLQLDGFLLIMLLSNLSGMFPQLPVTSSHMKAKSWQGLQSVGKAEMVLLKNLPRCRSRRSKRQLRRAGLLLCPGHACRMRSLTAAFSAPIPAA